MRGSSVEGRTLFRELTASQATAEGGASSAEYHVRSRLGAAVASRAQTRRCRVNGGQRARGLPPGHDRRYHKTYEQRVPARRGQFTHRHPADGSTFPPASRCHVQRETVSFSQAGRDRFHHHAFHLPGGHPHRTREETPGGRYRLRSTPMMPCASPAALQPHGSAHWMSIEAQVRQGSRPQGCALKLPPFGFGNALQSAATWRRVPRQADYRRNANDRTACRPGFRPVAAWYHPAPE